MEVKKWDGGLFRHEVDAIEKIAKKFSPGKVTPSKEVVGGGSLKDQLASGFGVSVHKMFPWRGYAGFRLVSAEGREGEFDLVIVTHCNVLIIELKHWNRQPVAARGDRWYKGDQEMGRSPVSITRNKKFTLEKKLKKLRYRFTNKGYVPHVYFFVVMTGSSDFSQLPAEQLAHTISLSTFLQFSDENKFDRKFNPHSKSKVLNQDFDIFDELFGTSVTDPKSFSVAGYESVDTIFKHPKNVYREFLARSEATVNSEALLRIWNFDNVEGAKASTPEGRASIASREREVLQTINYHSRSLYNHCLRSLTSFQKEDVTAEYSELYELPPRHVRFNEFIGKFGKTFSEADRLIVAKLVIVKFADLHEMKIAHRDIGDHSLWISPSKEIALSNFISAYHQPSGTVGDYRKLLSVVSTDLRESQSDSSETPFAKDTETLGTISWHLLTATRMSTASEGMMRDDLLSSDSWYTEVLSSAIDGKYESASEFFDELVRAEPRAVEVPTFNELELDPYRHEINHSRQFREDGEFIKETSDKEVFLSNGLLVKAWLNCNRGASNAAKSFNLLKFLKRVEKLQSISPRYLPVIREFGIATKSSSLYVVSDHIEGVAWNNLSLTKEDKVQAIHKLVNAVENLHSHGFSHGDLHPENVIVENDTGSLFLIDMPDFDVDGYDRKNHRYSPDNVETCSSSERDNYAVLRMSCELLGIAWGEESTEFAAIADVVKVELEDSQFGFRELGRFKKSIGPLGGEVKPVLLEVIVGNASEEIAVRPDNGRLYVSVKHSRKSNAEMVVKFSGIGGVFTAIYDKEGKAFKVGFDPHKRTSVTRRDIDESHFEINATVLVKPGSGRPHDLSSLTDFLNGGGFFERAIRLVELAKRSQAHGGDLSNVLDTSDKIKSKIGLGETPLEVEQPDRKVLTLESIVDAESEATEVPVATDDSIFEIATPKLWRAVLDTETESHPKIELSDDVIVVRGDVGEVVLLYTSDIDPLESFGKNDDVEAIVIDATGSESAIGTVSIRRSSLNEIRLKYAKKDAYNLTASSTVYFRSKLDAASFQKRKKALECLLEGNGVISDLMDRFDPSCTLKPIVYGINPSQDDFSRYDRKDSNGNAISLNDQQRAAFRKLLRYGPLSLLQGPPGTGKTEYIAAFVHYLIEAAGAKRILLVSQSHEAVNTAAERVRRHCARLDTSLEVVRFSNREGTVSSGLKDVYSNAITAEKRELFVAECKFRVEALSNALGLEKDFISSYVQAEIKLFKLIDSLVDLEMQIEKTVDEDEKVGLKSVGSDLETRIRGELRSNYEVDIAADQHVSSAKEMVISKLCLRYAVRPDEAKRVAALARITRDMQDAYSAERVNLDEFYARSRQLVTGTCVGIGQGHIGVQDNVYDWVIIDEAARSIASELAIAMQTAKRVLLVGDHLQLPPLYTDSHKDAVYRRLELGEKGKELDHVLLSDFARSFNSEYGRQVSATLLTQYRMSPPIGDLVSEIFYSGELRNGRTVVDDIYDDVPDALQSPVTWLDTSVMGEQAHHVQSNGPSISNRCEADLIISVLRQIAERDQFLELVSSEAKIDNPPIGIICMYSEQKKLLRKKFSQELWPDRFKSLIKIDTVDSYQGKENKIIIVSITRSDKSHSPGFLRTSNRINVAMSRAMDRLLVVGNADMWKGSNESMPLGQVLRYMQDKGSDKGYSVLDANIEK